MTAAAAAHLHDGAVNRGGFVQLPVRAARAAAGLADADLAIWLRIVMDARQSGPGGRSIFRRLTRTREQWCARLHLHSRGRRQELPARLARLAQAGMLRVLSTDDAVGIQPVVEPDPDRGVTASDGARRAWQPTIYRADLARLDDPDDPLSAADLRMWLRWQMELGTRPRAVAAATLSQWWSISVSQVRRQAARLVDVGLLTLSPGVRGRGAQPAVYRTARASAAAAVADAAPPADSTSAAAQTNADEPVEQGVDQPGGSDLGRPGFARTGSAALRASDLHTPAEDASLYARAFSTPDQSTRDGHVSAPVQSSAEHATVALGDPTGSTGWSTYAGPDGQQTTTTGTATTSDNLTGAPGSGAPGLASGTPDRAGGRRSRSSGTTGAGEEPAPSSPSPKVGQNWTGGGGADGVERTAHAVVGSVRWLTRTPAMPGTPGAARHSRVLVQIRSLIAGALRRHPELDPSDLVGRLRDADPGAPTVSHAWIVRQQIAGLIADTKAAPAAPPASSRLAGEQALRWWQTAKPAELGTLPALDRVAVLLELDIPDEPNWSTTSLDQAWRWLALTALHHAMSGTDPHDPTRPEQPDALSRWAEQLHTRLLPVAQTELTRALQHAAGQVRTHLANLTRLTF